MTTFHPERDPHTNTWFIAGLGLEAPTIRELLKLLPKGAAIADYYPDGFNSQPMVPPRLRVVVPGMPPLVPSLIVKSMPAKIERIRLDANERSRLALKPPRLAQPAWPSKHKQATSRPVKKKSMHNGRKRHDDRLRAPNERELMALRLAERDGLTFYQIAGVMGCSRSAVAGLIRRGRLNRAWMQSQKP